MKNEQLLNRQRKLNRIEEMLDAFRRKLVVLGRIEASEEVRYSVEKNVRQMRFQLLHRGNQTRLQVKVYENFETVANKRANRCLKNLEKIHGMRRSSSAQTESFSCYVPFCLILKLVSGMPQFEGIVFFWEISPTRQILNWIRSITDQRFPCHTSHQYFL